jgi:nucleoside-diphosphate-sugar epimerase
MKTLVTGGTGFIGSHVVERLLAAGHDVRVLVRNVSKGNWLWRQGAEPWLGDVTDRRALPSAVAGVDCVFHLAAYVSEWGPWRSFREVTVNGTKNLLAAAAQLSVPRFLHVSTATVYDDSFARRQRVISEDAPLGSCGDRAYGNYSKAKVLAERAVWQAHEQGQISATVLRPAWVYGPRDGTILPRLLEHMRGPLACWIGQKDPVVDPIFVTDVAECIYLAAMSSQAKGQAYNIAPDVEIGLRAFLGALSRELEFPLPRWSLPYNLALAATVACESWALFIGAGEVPALTQAGLASFTVDQHFDPAKAIRDLDWQPHVSLEAGAAQTAAWLRDREPQASQVRPRHAA